MTLFQTRLCRFIATLGPVGYLPMPGTMGTLCAVPLFILMRDYLKLLPFFNERFFIALFLLAAVWIINRALVLIHRHDPSEIILDEVVGFFVLMMDETLSVPFIVLGFLYFRFFDIVKPFGIDRLEGIGGGWGIVLDDVLAAIYARILLDITQYFFPI